MKLKSLILEGMYDKLTGQINKDLFKTLKNAIKGSGTQEKPKKYKGYEVRKDPIPMVGTMQDLFQSEKEHYMWVIIQTMLVGLRLKWS